MYQTYVGASLYEFIRDKQERLQRGRDDRVTERDVLIHLMDDEYVNEFKDQYLL